MIHVKVMVSGQIIYFLANASPPKLLDVSTLNFVCTHLT